MAERDSSNGNRTVTVMEKTWTGGGAGRQQGDRETAANNNSSGTNLDWRQRLWQDGSNGGGKMSTMTRRKIKLSSDIRGKTTEMAAVQTWHGGNSSDKMLATAAARQQQLHGCRANLAWGKRQRRLKLGLDWWQRRASKAESARLQQQRHQLYKLGLTAAAAAV